MRKRKGQKTEDADAREGKTVAKHYVFFFFACFVPSGGSKSRFAKATGAQPSGGCTAIIEMRDQELYLVVARTDLEKKIMSGTILAVEASKK